MYVPQSIIILMAILVVAMIITTACVIIGNLLLRQEKRRIDDYAVFTKSKMSDEDGVDGVPHRSLAECHRELERLNKKLY